MKFSKAESPDEVGAKLVMLIYGRGGSYQNFVIGGANTHSSCHSDSFRSAGLYLSQLIQLHKGGSKIYWPTPGAAGWGAKSF